jgi:hypothetical protein
MLAYCESFKVGNSLVVAVVAVVAVVVVDWDCLNFEDKFFLLIMHFDK